MTPILWSFRRCPYAMRARLGILYSGVSVSLREVVLRDKPAEFLACSPSGTVPCLKHSGGVLDESLDIMTWALRQSDPSGLMQMPQQGFTLIAENDGWFKTALDRYKYAVRFPDHDPIAQRARASEFLLDLDERLTANTWLFGEKPALADFAILPFVRQFAHVDMIWFADQEWRALARWLERFKTSGEFAAIMRKYEPWSGALAEYTFPEQCVETM